MERTAILEKPLSLPREALRWAAVCALYFIFAYWGCNWLASHRTGLGTVHFEWEKRIPLIPEMIIPYMSIDLFFAGSFFLCRGSRELAAHAKRLLLAMTIGGICFLLFPLELGFERQAVDHSLGWIFQALWFFDYPHNLAPSLHIAQLIILWPVYVRSTRGGLRFFVQLWFALIVVSTLLTHQHHVVDVLTGLLLGLYCFAAFPDPAAAALPIRKNGVLAARYGGGAALCLLAAWALHPWGLLLLWPALALAAVAGAYSGLGPAVLGKSGGRIPLHRRLLLAPYFLGARLSFRHFRRQGPPYREASPGLWMGRKLGPHEAEEMIAAKGIGAVLDLTAEHGEAEPFLKLSYKNLPLLDFTAPAAKELEEALDFIRRHLEGGTPVYVHCALGRVRSAAVVEKLVAATIFADENRRCD